MVAMLAMLPALGLLGTAQYASDYMGQIANDRAVAHRGDQMRAAMGGLLSDPGANADDYGRAFAMSGLLDARDYMATGFDFQKMAQEQSDRLAAIGAQGSQTRANQSHASALRMQELGAAASAEYEAALAAGDAERAEFINKETAALQVTIDPLITGAAQFDTLSGIVRDYANSNISPVNLGAWSQTPEGLLAQQTYSAAFEPFRQATLQSWRGLDSNAEMSDVTFKNLNAKFEAIYGNGSLTQISGNAEKRLAAFEMGRAMLINEQRMAEDGYFRRLQNYDNPGHYFMASDNAGADLPDDAIPLTDLGQ